MAEKSIDVYTLTDIRLADYDHLLVDEITDLYAEAFAEEAEYVAEQYLPEAAERELEDDEALAGQTLRDASLEDVAHYFVYNADRYAEVYLA